MFYGDDFLKYYRIAAIISALCIVLSASGCSDKKAENNSDAKIPVSDDSISSDASKTPDQNSGAISNQAYEIPTFSCDSGFYDKGFDLSLDISDSSLSIYYTTDGSTPTNKSEAYSKPITIKERTDDEKVLTYMDGTSPDQFTADKNLPMGTVIRAAAFDKDGVSGPVATNTYFVGVNRSEKYSYAAVVSLVTDADNLFDYEKGIYILGKAFDDWQDQIDISTAETWQYEGNYSQKGKDWEKPVNFELMESDGTVGFEQQLGARIMGTATRTYLQKSFRLYSRDEYGQKNIDYALIPEVKKENDDTEQLNKYKTFLLRNGGNDCDYTKLRDPFVQTIFSDRDYSTQGSRPAVVFINGEYWGLYAIEEDYSDNYLQYNYDIDKNDVVLIKRGELEEGLPDDSALYTQLVDLYSADLSDDNNYNKLCDVLDIQSSIDYFCTLILTANEDCIYTENNNWRIWRSRSVTDNEYQDGKWRFMLYDTEFSLGLYKNGMNAKSDSLNDAKACKMFESLMKNEEYKKQFALSYMDMLNFNFDPDISVPVLEKIADQYRPLRDDSIRRFGPEWASPMINGYFDNGVKEIKTFIKTRSKYAPDMLKSNLELKGETSEITVSVKGKGKVKINTSVPELTDGSFSGIYFTDYPVTLTAICESGNKFDGWSGGISDKSQTVTIPLSDALSVTANFSSK